MASEKKSVKKDTRINDEELEQVSGGLQLMDGTILNTKKGKAGEATQKIKDAMKVTKTAGGFIKSKKTDSV